MRRIVLPTVLFCCLLLASCGGQKDPSAAPRNDETSRLFTYDKNAQIPVTIDSTWSLDGITLRNAHFSAASPKHGQVQFTLVRPAGNGPFAAVFFFHWLGRPKGNREEFLDEAVALAAQGVVSLLIEGYFPWKEDPVSGSVDRQQIVDQTLDARKGLEVLIREPGVDQNRIAYVGHDYGAMFGAIIAGLESRVKTYVFVAGMGNFGDWSLKYWPPTAVGGEQAYRVAVAPVDPIHFITRAAPAGLFFQFASRDIYISRETALAFSDAASGTKMVKWYDAEHDMSTPEVRKDRHAWLAQHLDLSTPR